MKKGPENDQGRKPDQVRLLELAGPWVASTPDAMTAMVGDRLRSDPHLIELKWTTVSVPLERPLQAGELQVHSREYCCCRVELDGGAKGDSYVMTRGLAVGDALGALVAPRIFGADGRAQLDRIRSMLRNIGWDGPISRAVAVVRLAVVDAEARSRRMPVWQYLGATSAPSTPLAIVIGYTTPGEEPFKADARAAARAVEEGAGCVKLMGGFADPSYDLKRVTEVRRVVGDDVAIGIDANGAWPRPACQDVLPRLVDAGAAFVEEPWGYELGMSAFDHLPEQRPALAFGEISASVIELEALAMSGLVEHIRADATLLGGHQPLVALRPALQRSAARLFPHFWPDFHRHLIALAPASYIEDVLPRSEEFGLTRFVESERTVSRGKVVAPSTPGFGIHLDWAAIESLASSAPKVWSRVTQER